MKKRTSLQLFCFSPPVMIATFLFEIISALYIAWRYVLNNTTRIIIAILVCLGVFQYAEYTICQNLSISWAKIGFVAITLLPPLGFHLAQEISQRYSKLLTTFAYGSAAVFIGYFLFSNAISGSVCGGNYVIFHYELPIDWSYGVYYYGWLFVGLGYSLWRAGQMKFKKQRNTRHALQLLALGYVLFMLPTTIVNVINPNTIIGIPSIMCGFAVILAIILTFFIAPRVTKPRR